MTVPTNQNSKTLTTEQSTFSAEVEIFVNQTALDLTTVPYAGDVSIMGDTSGDAIVGALHMDGTAAVQVSGCPTLAATSFAFEFWVRMPVGSPEAGLVSATADYCWHFSATASGELRLFLPGYWDGTLFGTHNVKDGLWHHIVFTRDGSSNTVYVFVDGVIDITVAGSGTIYSTDWYFGSWFLQQYNMVGYMDEIAFYNDFYPLATAIDRFALGRGEQYVTDTIATATHYWRFENNLIDSIGTLHGEQIGGGILTYTDGIITQLSTITQIVLPQATRHVKLRPASGVQLTFNAGGKGVTALNGTNGDYCFVKKDAEGRTRMLHIEQFLD